MMPLFLALVKGNPVPDEDFESGSGSWQVPSVPPTESQLDYSQGEISFIAIASLVGIAILLYCILYRCDSGGPRGEKCCPSPLNIIETVV